MEIGIYIETEYTIDFFSKALYCKDIYTFLWNKLEEHNLNFIGKSNPHKTGSHYRINRFSSYTELTWYSTLASLLISFPFYYLRNKKKIEGFVKRSDIIIAATPSPIGIAIIKLGLKYKKKCIVLVRQDSNKLIKHRYRGVTKIIASFTTMFLERYIESTIRKRELTVLTLGKDLYLKYKKLSKNTKLFVSSRFSTLDIVNQIPHRLIDFNKPIKMLYVGRIEKEKGLIELLQAIANIGKTKINLSIIGEGSIEGEIASLIYKLGIQSSVTMPGYVPYGKELLQIYREHDILILPSYSEGMPQVILEGMSQGILVLATRVGGIPYIIDNGINGLLFEPRSISAIINILNNLGKYNIQNIINNGILTANNYAQEKQLNVLKMELSHI